MSYFTVQAERGLDLENNIYACIGMPSSRFEEDIARSVAWLAVLALDPTTAPNLPTCLRIAGQNVSYEEIRDVVARVKGVPQGDIKSIDLNQFKDNLRAHPSDDYLDYIGVLIGQGKLDYSTENVNQLVNSEQTLWKWKTVEDHLRASL